MTAIQPTDNPGMKYLHILRNEVGLYRHNGLWFTHDSIMIRVTWQDEYIHLECELCGQYSGRPLAEADEALADFRKWHDNRCAE